MKSGVYLLAVRECSRKVLTIRCGLCRLLVNVVRLSISRWQRGWVGLTLLSMRCLAVLVSMRLVD